MKKKRTAKLIHCRVTGKTKKTPKTKKQQPKLMCLNKHHQSGPCKDIGRGYIFSLQQQLITSGACDNIRIILPSQFH